MGIEDVYHIFPRNLNIIFSKMKFNAEKLEEIRMRVNKPLVLKIANESYFVSVNGELCKSTTEPLIVDRDTIGQVIQFAGEYSIYAYEGDIRNGFITIKGGHRIGIAGRIVMDNEQVKTIKNISYLNIRIAHEIKGCAKNIIPYIFGNEKRIHHTLIISPPGCGKTTLLRDLIRLLSDGCYGREGVNVAVVDERSEIAACHMGMEQNDLGIRTDVLDGCPKSIGMLMLIRSMAPSVVAVDEIGSAKDIEALQYIIKCGCSCIATVHGNSIDDLKNKPVLGKMIRDRIFERYIILGNHVKVGRVEGIFDERGTSLFKAC